MKTRAGICEGTVGKPAVLPRFTSNRRLDHGKFVLRPASQAADFDLYRRSIEYGIAGRK
jgi:hypothetical protein